MGGPVFFFRFFRLNIASTGELLTDRTTLVEVSGGTSILLDTLARGPEDESFVRVQR